MQEITRHNYEAFLLDLSEGNLSAADQAALEAFLQANPELAVDVEDLSFSLADPERIAFSDKEALKKTETDLVSADTFIAYIEQQLTPAEEQQVQASCAANPSLSKELKRYEATISGSDNSIVFEGKERLKRKPAIIWFNFSATQFAAAASVALFLLLYLVWPSNPVTVPVHDLAHTSIPKQQQRQSSSIPQVPTKGSELASQSLPSNHGSGKASKSQTLPVVLTNTLSAVPPIQLAQVPHNGPGLQRPDTLPPSNNRTPENMAPPKEVLIASTKQATVVDVITESDEDEAPAKKKQGFWAMAGKALNNLNKAGVKSVDGQEQATKENASYALTLGALNITHKTH